MRKKTLIMAVAVTTTILDLVFTPIQAMASEYAYTGIATEADMDKEVAMYNEETGEFFFVEDQEAADEFTEKYGWAQVIKESVNNGIPEYIKKAGEADSDLEENDVTEAKSADDATEKSVDESLPSETAEDEERPNEEKTAVADEVNAANSNDVEVESAKDDNVDIHGPFEEMNDDAKSALFSLLENDSVEDDERYIKIYGTASSIIIDTDTWGQICSEGKAFSVKIVGAKDNLLYQYNFSYDSLKAAESDIELKLTAVEEDDIYTYMSFHKTQSLPGAVEFVYPQAAERTDYEVRTLDGEKIVGGTSDDTGVLKLMINATDNYELVDIDHEGAVGTANATVANKKNNVLIFIGAGATVVVLIGISVFVFKKKRR